MKRRQLLTALIVLVVVATLYMFLVAVIVDTLGEDAVPFVFYTCIPASVVLLLLAISALTLIVIDMLHKLIIQWAEREAARRMKYADMQHHYRVKRKMREFESREQLRIAQQRRFRVNRSVYRHQHNLRHRNKQNGH